MELSKLNFVTLPNQINDLTNNMNTLYKMNLTNSNLKVRILIKDKAMVKICHQSIKKTKCIYKCKIRISMKNIDNFLFLIKKGDKVLIKMS